MSSIWPNNIWHKSKVGRRWTEVWRGKPAYFSVNCRFSTSTQDQFAIKDLGVACAQKNRMLFVYVLVSFFLNSSFRLNGREDLREEETLTLIQ